MFIIDDNELNELVDKCNKRAAELGVEFIASTFTDAPPGPDVPENSRHYSCIGTCDVANTQHVPMYADIANDIVTILGVHGSQEVLGNHLGALNNIMWQLLDNQRDSVS